MTNCSCGTCECQETITKLESQQLNSIRTIASLEMQIEKLQTKKHMFPENVPQEEEECVACSA